MAKKKTTLKAKAVKVKTKQPAKALPSVRPALSVSNAASLAVQRMATTQPIAATQPAPSAGPKYDTSAYDNAISAY